MGDPAGKTMQHPANLKYVKTHEFVKVEGDIATIGITAFAADQLGDVTYVELPKVGATLKNEQKFGVIESVKSVSDLYMPLTGEVIAINEALSSEPELVNVDCYTQGWMIKVKVADVAELNSLLSADDYSKLIAD